MESLDIHLAKSAAKYGSGTVVYASVMMIHDILADDAAFPADQKLDAIKKVIDSVWKYVLPYSAPGASS